MKKVVLATAIASLTLSGCAIDQMSKSQIGTGAGAIIGGLIGQNNGGVVGALVGAAIGGGIGYLIGSDMDEEDQKALAAKTQQNIDHMKVGEAIDWKSDRTDSSARVVVLNEKTEVKSVDVAALAAIEVPANMGAVSQTWKTKSQTPIYTGARESANTVATLYPGKTVRVVGKTEDGNWMLVSRNGMLVGFVPTSKMQRVVIAKQPETKNQAESPKVHAQATDLDSLPMSKVAEQKPQQKAAFDLDAQPKVTMKVPTQVECKTLGYQIKTKNGVKNADQQACKAPGGTWQI